nr:immunoglobulin heavy chain junction region [Mus musculus]
CARCYYGSRDAMDYW